MAGLMRTGIAKADGDADVLHDMGLDIASGASVVLVGPSGCCGKSTLLRMIAGLEQILGG